VDLFTWTTGITRPTGQAINEITLNRNALTTIVAIVVTVVWSIATLVALARKDYTGLSIVTPVMLVVAGFLFGLRERRNGSSHA
jgi:ATP/ADP translocase